MDVDARNDPDKELSFDYSTRCLLGDRACLTNELDRLWPTLRSLADGQSIARINIWPEDCSGSSVALSLERSREGLWKDGLWSPKEQ